jgi:hypothetical protein
MIRAVPPLLALAAGKRVRLRKPPFPKEISLHIDTARLLRQHCLPEWLWSHFASGELRDIRTAAKLKAMGVKRGWPDFVCIAPDGRVHCLELKREGEGLSEAQQQFQVHCVKYNWP